MQSVKSKHEKQLSTNISETQSHFAEQANAAKQTYVKNNSVLLATALIKAKAADGRTELLRALIDPGSQSSFVTESAAQMLALPRFKVYAKIAGIGGTDAGVAQYKIRMNIQPRFPSSFSINIETLVFKNLTKLLPDSKVQLSIPWKNRIAADPTYDKPGPVDLILGADVFGSILLQGVYKLHSGLIMQETELGWILTGQTGKNVVNTTTCSLVINTDINSSLKKFWELEEVPKNPSPAYQDECEQHFAVTHSRSRDGTYTVRIPFKQVRQPLGDSRKQALARFLQIEKKFEKDNNYAKEYKRFMQEYLYLGHMIPVSPYESAGEKYYLPHQAVLKHDSSTTKVRVVFDGSATTTTGVSLNENMLVGPRLQEDLSNIILRGRKYKYLFTADIEKMYRQIKVDERDQDFQRILFRFTPNEPVKEYKLTTVTYGTASAPYLAIKTIQQLAKDEENKYPQAAQVVLRDFYVDDLMSGADTLDQAKIMVKDLMQLMKSGGFSLRKWISNNTEILELIPEDKREKGSWEISDDETIKTLGIYWSPKKDQFQFKVQELSPTINITKRTMLSETAKIFDPLGWLTPVTIKAKIMLQELWLAGLDWDTLLPHDLATRWFKYRNGLTALGEITIARWIQTESSHSPVELHGFCDASEKAFAAVIYSKVTTSTGNIIVSLLTAKSKVAPIKSKATIPKLELCAAVLLAKLIENTRRALALENVAVHLWSDSQIVLAWIKGSPNRWEKFVASRVTEIQRITDPYQWRYINTTQNPADCASRGVDPEQLKNHALWWNGPKQLKDRDSAWPILPTVERTEFEMRQVNTMTITVSTELFERFSSLNRLVRVVAYIYRFIANCRKRRINKSLILTTQEIDKAINTILTIVQQKEFPDEVFKLKNNKLLSPKSRLRQLNPFLDEHGILRIGGRLQNSQLTYNEKHPIILPSKGHITTLVVNDAHAKTFHSGNQNTLAYIRRKYWIIDARNVIRHQIHKCVKCARFRAKTGEQQMGNLPLSRVTPSKPFTHTGIDYAGPIKIRASKIRRTTSYKGYIAVFVCMTTKGIHIELVSDLTTEAFLAAFKRFTARRGSCSHIYSDCGTNFIGARRSLEIDLRKAIQNSERHVANLLVSDGIQWHFNPPAAPHFGGIWEAAVKSIKYHMKRVIGDTILTFEELTTVLYQIEGCLNSRPLCQLSSDPHDHNVITPGHFLIGCAPLAPPQPYVGDEKITPLKRWRLIEKITRDIWKSWSSDYLSQLQQRTKWREVHKNAHPGELVLIKDENLPPTKWLLGRITNTYPGSDGKVRVVELRCKGNSTLTRPISKICKLPIEEAQYAELNITKPEVPTSHQIQSGIANRSKHKTALHSGSVQPKKKKRRINPVTGYTTLVSTAEQNKHRLQTHMMENEQRDQKRQRQEASPPPKKRITLNEYRSRRKDQANCFLTCFMLLLLIKLGRSAVNITYPAPGLYIEHVGEANVRRGSLRVELNYPLNRTNDVENINDTILQMEKMCERASKKSEDIHCDQFLHHMREKQHLLLRDIDIISIPMNGKGKRGVFGNILQYFFGVNDEVYTEIDSIKQNQENIIQTTQHQTNLMLSTVAQIKNLESTTQQKMSSFNKKLEKAMTELNKVEGWFSSIDVNRINIHLLAAYEIAMGILEELENRYTLLIRASLDKGNLLDFVSPGELLQLIHKISSRIPFNIKILHKPENKIESRLNSTHFTVYGFLQLVATSTYNVMKITPIPRKVDNQTYIVPKIENPVIAADYNSQTYFELSEIDLQQCLRQRKHHFLCSPPAISKIDTNSNCVLDEIYQRHERHDCNYMEVKVSNILFKYLYQKNAWLFITNKPAIAAVICNGVHEDVELKEIGIIQISQGCIIKTKRNILTSEMTDTIPVKSTFNQPIKFNISQIDIRREIIPAFIEEETILRPTDHLSILAQPGTEIQDRITHHNWKTVYHHVATGTTTVIIILVAAALYKYRDTWKRVLTFRNNSTEPQPATRTVISNLRPQLHKNFNLQQFDDNTSSPAPSIMEAENVHATYATIASTQHISSR